MTKNPYINALLAGAYIALIVLLMNTFVDNPALENSAHVIFIPMAMLSLFVFSAAVMGFLFVYRPLALYLDGKKQEAVIFFGKTLATFAVCVAIFMGLLLSGL